MTSYNASHQVGVNSQRPDDDKMQAANGSYDIKVDIIVIFYEYLCSIALRTEK